MFDMIGSQYFKSLPDDIRERVWNCGLIFHTEDDLKSYVTGLAGI